MPTKINTEICNGEMLAASQEMIQERLEAFADSHPRVKEIDVSVDVGNPNNPEVEITAPLGGKVFVGTGSAKSAVEAVDDAIQNLDHQLLQRLRDRKAEAEEEEEPVDQEEHLFNISKWVALVILAGIFGVTIMRMDSCSYNPAIYPETASVTGTVTLDGEPLEGATVTFVPPQGRASAGKTDANGKYKLYYTGAIKGAMLGSQRVMISKLIPDPDYVPPKAERELQETIATTPPVPLDPEIAAAMMEPVELPPPMIDFLPDRYHGIDSELSVEVKDTNNVFDFALESK